MGLWWRDNWICRLFLPCCVSRTYRYPSTEVTQLFPDPLPFPGQLLCREVCLDRRSDEGKIRKRWVSSKEHFRHGTSLLTTGVGSSSFSSLSQDLLNQHRFTDRLPRAGHGADRPGGPRSPGPSRGSSRQGRRSHAAAAGPLGGASGTMARSQACTGRAADLGPQGPGEPAGAARARSAARPAGGCRGPPALAVCVPAAAVPAGRHAPRPRRAHGGRQAQPASRPGYQAPEAQQSGRRLGLLLVRTPLPRPYRGEGASQLRGRQALRKEAEPVPRGVGLSPRCRPGRDPGL